ncbi:cytochrome P450 [Streptomyces sp. NPDC127051]|uniref:cytochrome P450 family protein n=1 Tax=Streptomyces sp. NPDC127051 TaxID=3347119 RepID=UPI00364F904A
MPDPQTDPFSSRYPSYAALRRGRPVRRIPRAEGPDTWIVTGYAEACQAFTDPRISKDAARFYADWPVNRDLHPALVKHLLNSDPPEHTRLRKLVARAFTSKAVSRLRPHIQQITDGLVASWSPGEPVDAVEQLTAPLPVALICDMFGVPEADRASIRRWTSDLFATGDTSRIDTASHTIADYMTQLITDKRCGPDDSLLSDLITARDQEDHLTEAELVSLAVLLFMGKVEPTTSGLNGALLTLLQEPHAVERLREDPDRISSLIDELLRYDTPVSIASFRCTTAPVLLGETEVPKDALIYISPGGANRDPARFPKPDSFAPDRDATGHLAFGHGRHRCFGAPLVHAETEIVLRTLFSRFPNLRLAVPPAELHWRQFRMIRSLVELPILV